MGVVEFLLLKHVFIELLELALQGLNQLLVLIQRPLILFLKLFFCLSTQADHHF